MLAHVALVSNLKSIHVYALNGCKYAMMKFEHLNIYI